MIKILKALADNTRLRILALLSHGEFTVQELTIVLEIGQSCISHHLKVLLEVGIVSVKRQGTWGYYRLNLENKFFSGIYPTMEKSFFMIPEISDDSVKLLNLLDERRRSSRGFFDREAHHWDQLIRNILSLPDYLEEFSRMVPESSVAVEIGCGTGNFLESLKNKAAFVIGVDQSPQMIQEAKQKIRHKNLQGIELRLSDMIHLPLGNNEAELVVLNMTLHHAAQPLQTLKEVSRVLKRGGNLLLADLLPHGEDWVRAKLADQWLGFSHSELDEWLNAAGISIETWREIKGEGKQMNIFLLKGEKEMQLKKSESMSLF
jgi:ArsR family transcriptional regulator